MENGLDNIAARRQKTTAFDTVAKFKSLDNIVSSVLVGKKNFRDF